LAAGPSPADFRELSLAGDITQQRLSGLNRKFNDCCATMDILRTANVRALNFAYRHLAATQFRREISQRGTDNLQS
jgi:hypothetical protein